jgi:hypothetical protein
VSSAGWLVHPKIWDDRKFMGLHDTGRIIWMYFLTSPIRNSLPGLFRGTVLSVAEGIERSPEKTQIHLDAVLATGMAQYDPERRLFRLPKAPLYTKGPNPNIVKSWWKDWQLLPDSELKYQHVPALADAVNLRNAVILRIWSDTFGKVLEGLPPSMTNYDFRNHIEDVRTSKQQNTHKPSRNKGKSGSERDQKKGIRIGIGIEGLGKAFREPLREPLREGLAKTLTAEKDTGIVDSPEGLKQGLQEGLGEGFGKGFGKQYKPRHGGDLESLRDPLDRPGGDSGGGTMQASPGGAAGGESGGADRRSVADADEALDFPWPL